MRIKDFSIWHKLKSWLHNEQPRIFFHVGEIWFCHLGQNIGFEQDGKNTNFLRPVLILKKFNNEIFWAIPLTKTVKESPYYYTFEYQPGIKSVAILSQLRLLDAKRLNYKSGSIKPEQLTELKQKLKQLLA